MKLIFKVIVSVLILLCLIQFVPIDQTFKRVPKVYGILEQENAPERVDLLLRNACYDCHSNETEYPEYAQYAPISWYIEYHVEEGRKNANFSRWKKYDKDQKAAIVQNSIEVLESNSMPLKSYVAKHPEANLTKKDRRLLIEWFENFNN